MAVTNDYHTLIKSDKNQTFFLSDIQYRAQRNVLAEQIQYSHHDIILSSNSLILVSSDI